MCVPETRSNAPQQNAKAGHWLAADLGIPRTDLGLQPPTPKPDLPAEMNLGSVPTSLMDSLSRKVHSCLEMQHPRAWDKLGHTYVAGLPRDRARAWPYRPEPGRRKGK